MNGASDFLGSCLSAVGVVLVLLISLSGAAHGSGLIQLDYDKGELEARWKARIRSLLNAGKLPKIDMETSFQEKHLSKYVPEIFEVMNELGIALFAADGYQAGASNAHEGYRWSDYIRGVVNRHPDRFIPTSNGGTNKN